MNPMSELAAIIKSDVPIAFLGVSLHKNINAGIIIKPPPEPTNPVKNPTNDPFEKINK